MGDAYNKSVYICLLFLSKAICWSVCLVLLVPRVQIIGLTTNVFIFTKFVYFCCIKSSRHRWGPTMGASNNTWKNGWYSYMLAFRVSVFCWSILFLDTTHRRLASLFAGSPPPLFRPRWLRRASPTMASLHVTQIRLRVAGGSCSASFQA